MSQLSLTNCAAVVLAAGKGTRLGCTDIPKVMLEIGGNPIVSYTVDTLEAMGFSPEQIVLVVGFKKEKVEDYFGDRVQCVHQTEQKGTAHAAYTGICALPDHIEHVLVIQGDDSAFYTKESLLTFVNEHVSKQQTFSLLSVEVEDPSILGRIVRHDDGKIEIIEKEYITEEQKHINEISTGTFAFDRNWFQQMFPTMPQLRKIGEYGLPTSLAEVQKDKLPYQVVNLGKSNEWFGINRPEELAEADRRKRETL